jgi:hypothetical protein
MFGLGNLEVLFVISAFLFQIILIIHFAMRKWYFNLAMRYGWIVYGLSLAAAAVSVLLLLGGKPWSLWAGGFIYLIWAIFGYIVEYIRDTQWRNPIRWSIFGPYVFLYLATAMFYWWPLALIRKPLWYVYAVLFIISTVLNVISHKGPQDIGQSVL